MTQKVKIILLSLSFVAAGLFFSAPALAASSIGNGCASTNQTTAALNKCLKGNQVVQDIQLIVNFLSGGVAIVIAGSIIVGGIQYTMAGNQPQVTKAAQNRIINSMIALFAFLLTFAFLQWLIPGGIFK